MVVVMVTAGGGGLKVAAPDFELRLIKTLVQYLRRGGGARRISNLLSEGFPN